MIEWFELFIKLLDNLMKKITNNKGCSQNKIQKNMLEFSYDVI